MKKVRFARDGYLIISVVFYIAGILYIALPGVPPAAVCISSGIVLMAYGIIKIIGYFSSDLYCLAFQYDLACGLLLLVLGVIVLICRQSIYPYLAPGLGMLILVDNFLAVQISYDAKRFGLRAWRWILAVAILVVCFAVLQIIKLFERELPSHVIAGCVLLAEGVKNQCIVSYTVKVIKKPAPLQEE